MKQILRINKEVVVQKTKGKTIIFNGSSSEIHTLNGTATEIFQKIKLGWQREKITQHFVKIYDVSASQAQKDVDKILKQLIKKNVLVKE